MNTKSAQPSRIDKIEEVIDTLGTTLSSLKSKKEEILKDKKLKTKHDKFDSPNVFKFLLESASGKDDLNIEKTLFPCFKPNLKALKKSALGRQPKIFICFQFAFLFF